MVSTTPLDGVCVEGDHSPRTKPQYSPTSDGEIGLGNGVFSTFSSQQSRTLNNRTGGSSSHGDGPRGDELMGSEISDEALYGLGENQTAEQGEPDLLPADLGPRDDRQELQEGEDKLTDDPPEQLASDQASSSSGDRGEKTDVNKKSTTDKSYVPSAGNSSPRPSGKRKLSSSMRGLSTMNTRSRTRLEDNRDDSLASMNLKQAEPVRGGGAKGSKKKIPAAAQKRVAKKPFGSGETGLEPNIEHNKSPTELGALRGRGPKSESPGNLSSASSNQQQHTAHKNTASSATTGNAPDMSIYDVEGSPEPENPAARKTVTKGRSKKRTAAAQAPMTTDQRQPAKKAPNRKAQARSGPKSQAKSPGNKKVKPLQTYGRPVAQEVGDESPAEKITIPNSKKRRSQAGHHTTDRPVKKPKADNDTYASPSQDDQASSASRKAHIMSTDDGEGVAEHGDTFNVRPNPILPRMQTQAPSPAGFGKSAQDESTRRFTTYGTTQWASATGHRPSKPAFPSGQEKNDAPQSTGVLGDKRASLSLQGGSHLPQPCRHSSIPKTASIKPKLMVSESERFPRIGQGILNLDRSNHLTPLFSGQHEQYLEALPASTAGQRDDRQSSPYSLHPRSMTFLQKLSSMQAALEKERLASKVTDHIQPQAAKDQNSSQAEALDDSLKGKNRWQAAVDETSQGLADTMHSITNAVLRELTSKEASIDSIVKEYSRNGAMIAAGSFRRQQEERERAVAQFEHLCTDLSHAFSCATEESMEMQTELSSKMRWLRQLVTKRRRDHGEIMGMDSAKSANLDATRSEQ